MQAVLFYCGACVIFLWGIGHLIPTRNVVSGFGPLTPDNRRIITMEWLVEGLTLCFLGILVAGSVSIIGPNHASTHLIARACAAFLILLAINSSLTGARTSIIPMKLCPYIKSAVAALYVVATLI